MPVSGSHIGLLRNSSKITGSLQKFHSKTNLGGRSGANIKILIKAGMRCTWVSGREFLKIKPKGKHNFRKLIGRQFLMGYGLC